MSSQAQQTGELWLLHREGTLCEQAANRPADIFVFFVFGNESLVDWRKPQTWEISAGGLPDQLPGLLI